MRRSLSLRHLSAALPRPLLLAALLLAGGLGPIRVAGQSTVTWANAAGIAGSNFETAANWTGGAPSSLKIAVFDTVTVTPRIRAAGTTAVAGLSFISTASVSILGTATFNLTIGASGISNTSTSGTKSIVAGVVLAANQTFTNNGTLTQSGTLTLGARALTFTGTGANGTISGVISGTGTITKTGSGSLTLSGTNTYTGNTTVNAGTLKVSGSSATSAFTVNSGGTLKGTGTVGDLTVAAGGILSPGNSPGTLNAGNTTFAAGGTFTFELNNATGTAGTNWDKLSLTGALTLDATSANPFVVNLASLTLANAAGLAANFDATVNSTFTFVTTTDGVANFAADKFSVDTSAFTNPFGGAWAVALTNDGKDLSVTYTASAIPEPATYAALAGAFALGLAAYRRRRS
jgi:autotransporter-associated beta strand protein